METMTQLGAIDTRSGQPRAVRLSLCCNHSYLTFTGGCDCDRATTPSKERFAVVGTNYGFLHTLAGDIRMWNSASGARKAAKAYATARDTFSV